MAKKSSTAAPEAAAPDLFTKKPIEIFKVKASSTPKKGSGSDQDIDGVEILAAASLILKNLESKIKEQDTKVRDKVKEIFYTAALENKERPENFKATDKTATASCQLRKKGSNVLMDPEVAEILDKHKISYDKEAVVEQRYVFNPEVLNDPETRQAISEALSSHPKLKGKDIIQVQNAEIKRTVGEKTLEEIAAKIKDLELLMKLYAECGVISVGTFKLQNNTTAAATEILKKAGIL